MKGMKPPDWVEQGLVVILGGIHKHRKSIPFSPTNCYDDSRLAGSLLLVCMYQEHQLPLRQRCWSTPGSRQAKQSGSHFFNKLCITIESFNKLCNLIGSLMTKLHPPQPACLLGHLVPSVALDSSSLP